MLTAQHVLRPPLLWAVWGPLRTKKSNKTGEGSIAQLLGGVAEGTGGVQPGERKAQRRPCHSVHLIERRL